MNAVPGSEARQLRARLARLSAARALWQLGKRPPSLSAPEAQQLQVWENESGTTVRAGELVRILIVDDNVSAADFLERMLRTLGYSQIRVAYSGHTALGVAGEFHPEVVLLDLSLADMSGYEVAQSLREHAQRHDLRLIALTSSREHAGRELARAAGFERYLLKPVVALDLSALLKMQSL